MKRLDEQMENSIGTALLVKKINGELSNQEEGCFDAWFTEKEEHRIYFRNMSREFDKKEPHDILRPNFSEVIRGQISIAPVPKPRKISIKKLLPVAASLLIGICIFLFISNQNQKSVNKAVVQNKAEEIQIGTQKAILQTSDGTRIIIGEEKKELANGASIDSQQGIIDYSGDNAAHENNGKLNKLIIPRGAEYQLVLSDGSKVWINSDSELEYPVVFGTKERVVTLKGLAYFEVEKDQRRPFKVISGGQELRVLGTAFSIRADENKSRVNTILVEGKVSVYEQYEESNAIELTPGNQTIFDKTSKEITKTKANIKEALALKEGKFYFNDRTLKYIITEMQKWYDFEYVFVDKELENLTFTGEIIRYQDFGEAVSIISKTGEVKFEIDGKKIMIK